MRFFFLLAFLLMASAILPQQQVDITLSADPPRMRPGGQSLIRARLKNPYRDQQIILQATATWQDAQGNTYTTVSNQVVLTIDYSVPIRLEVPLQPLSLVSASAKWDGQPVDVSLSNAGLLTVDLVLPGDGLEHVLELGVTK